MSRERCDAGSGLTAPGPGATATARMAKARLQSKSQHGKHGKRGRGKTRTHGLQQKEGHDDQPANSEDSKPFPFLELPAELRNNIYEKVFDELPEVYLTTRSRTLSSRSALQRVSRQVRNEFIPIMYLCAREIVAKVTNMNFGHIITFLNKLSDMEMEALVESPISERKMRIELVITGFPGGDYPAQLHALTRWINRLDHPTKRGTKINASYIITEANENIRNLRLGLRMMRFPGEKRKQEEVDKIQSASTRFLESRIA